MGSDFDFPVTAGAPPRTRRKIHAAVWIGASLAGGMGTCLICMVTGGALLWNANRDPQGVIKIAGKGAKASGQADEKPVATLNAADLFMAYRRNEADADLRFTGKIIEINEMHQQQFNKLRKNQDGLYTYDFHTNILVDWNEFLATPRFAVHIVFRPSETEKLARGLSGLLMIRGRCIGNVARDVGYGGNYPMIVDALLR
jgi:hypothetical protein